MHTGLGSLAYQEGDLTAAAREFNAALELSPYHVDAEMGLGDLALLAGDSTTAEQRYRRAVENLPAYAASYSYDSATIYRPLLYMRLALAARQAGDTAGEQVALQSAAATLAALQQAAPDWASVAAAEGILSLIRGDEEGAAGAFARSIACDRTLAEAQGETEKLIAAGSEK
jgi:tetratricopeptide (TPR) repeat protein